MTDDAARGQHCDVGRIRKHSVGGQVRCRTSEIAIRSCPEHADELRATQEVAEGLGKSKGKKELYLITLVAAAAHLSLGWPAKARPTLIAFLTIIIAIEPRTEIERDDFVRGRDAGH